MAEIQRFIFVNIYRRNAPDRNGGVSDDLCSERAVCTASAAARKMLRLVPIQPRSMEFETTTANWLSRIGLQHRRWVNLHGAKNMKRWIAIAIAGLVFGVAATRPRRWGISKLTARSTSLPVYRSWMMALSSWAVPLNPRAM